MKMKNRLGNLRLMSLVLGTGLVMVNPISDAYAATENLVAEVVQQSTAIKGVVLDSNGDPIIGATVLEKGTTNGTVTDLDGNFSLNVTPGATIQFSYIGYQQQELKASANMRVQLKEDTEVLEEVVVVGFGTQKKVNLTGSVGTADAKQLESRPVVNASQALQGLVPGLQITQNGGSLESRPSINIRGTATIGQGSSGSPLILIDGVEGDLNAINPQDIENISVLKDAASSSIYGSRAPFGVVLITTKKGREGKTTVNYNNSFRWMTLVNRPHMMDSYTFATYFNDALMNNGDAPFFNDEALQRIKDYQDGKLKESCAIEPGSNYWNGYAYGNDNVDWYDAIYKDWSFAQEHNISANGGNEAVNYYLSANMLDQDGLMKLSEEYYKRYNTSAKINAKLASWAKINYGIRFSREDYKRPSTMTNNLYRDLARQGWPTLPLYDPNGYLYSSPSPALGLATGGSGTWQTDNITNQATLIIEPVKNWITNIDFNYSIKTVNTHWDIQKTYNHDINGEAYLASTSSHVHEDHLKDNYMNFNAYTEYSFDFNDSHNFKVMGGFQAENMNRKTFAAQREGIIIPSLPEIDLTTGLSHDGQEVVPSVSGARNSWSTAGFFGRLNYDYKGIYLFEANLRYDGSSRFRRNNRWNWFPSFSVGWNVARENFWKPLENVVNTFKLRASYGELGNQNTNNWYPTYQTMGVYSASGPWLQGGKKPNVAYTPGLISAALTWERVTSWNIGLDFGAFDNRLTGSVDVYNRNTLDMIGPAPELPSTLGTGVPVTNNTDLRTYGWELQMSWNDRLNNGLGYSVRLTLSDAQTKITRYPNDTKRLDWYIAGTNTGDIWGYETVGIAKSDEEMKAHLESMPNGAQNSLGSNWAAGDIMYKDVNGDGKVDWGNNTLNDHGDLKKIGNSTPRYQFGVDLSADWKGFDFRAFFQGVAKRDFWSGSYYFWGAYSWGMWWSTGFKEHEDYFRAEPSNDLPANLDSYYPRPLFNGKNQQVQTRYLQNAAYIRLKNLQIGYTLPSKWTRSWGVSKVRFFLSGENLWTGTNLATMFDPETVDGGNNSYESQGNAYPLQKTLSVGLSLTL